MQEYNFTTLSDYRKSDRDVLLEFSLTLYKNSIELGTNTIS